MKIVKLLTKSAYNQSLQAQADDNKEGKKGNSNSTSIPPMAIEDLVDELEGG